jgi:hypothetical protein
MEKSVVKRETRDEALIRLAAQARAQGVQLLRVVATGEVFATSISRPGELHRLTHYSCDCEGFIRHQRCQHYAKLMDSLGWLPEVASNEPATTPCLACRGAGECWRDGQFTPDPCFYCRGKGRVDTHIDRVPTNNIVPFPSSDDRRPAA